jgi:HEPN domain-containing protein
MTDTENLDNSIIELLPIIDEELGSINIPLNQRPFQAACTLVDKVITKIRGNDRNDYYEKPWFIHIYNKTYDWYENKYADRFANDKSKSTILAHVIFSGVIYRIGIPIVLSEPADDESMSWMIIPKDILPYENVLNWIELKPNISLFTSNEKELLINNISSIGLYHRNINNSLMSVSIIPEQIKSFGYGAVANFQTASNIISDNKTNEFDTAIWEIHIAVEKMLKLALFQKDNEIPYIHDLRKLNNKLTQNSIVKQNSFFNLFPDDHTAINARYGQIHLSNLETVNQYFVLGLEYCSNIAESLDRILIMRNGRFLLKNPFYYAGKI